MQWNGSDFCLHVPSVDPDVGCKRKEGHLTKTTPHSFSAFPREFLADDLTPLFHPFPLQRWLLIWVKGSREGGIDWETLARGKRKDSPWGPPDWCCMPRMDPFPPSGATYHLTTTVKHYIADRWMPVFSCRRRGKRRRAAVQREFGFVLNTGMSEGGDGNDFQTVNAEMWWKVRKNIWYTQLNDQDKQYEMLQKRRREKRKRKEWAALRRKTQPQMATRGSHWFAFFTASSPFASLLMYLFFLQV